MQAEFAKSLQKDAGGPSVCVGADAEGNPLPVARLWASVAASGTELKWYGKGESYWASARPDDHGVLGGQTHINAVDSLHSLRFMRDLQAKLHVGSGRAIDCGAGVGRATDRVLQHGFSALELLEQEPRMLVAARERLSRSGLCSASLPIRRLPDSAEGGCEAGSRSSSSASADAAAAGGLVEASSPAADRSARVEALHCSGLQGFRFPPGVSYDCVWLQWVIGCVTDVDFIEFLSNAAASLTLPHRLRKHSKEVAGGTSSCVPARADASAADAAGCSAGRSAVAAASETAAEADATTAPRASGLSPFDMEGVADRAAGGGVIVIKDNVLLINREREAQLRELGKSPGPYSGCVPSAAAAAVLMHDAASSSASEAAAAIPPAAAGAGAPSSAGAGTTSPESRSAAASDAEAAVRFLRWNSLSLPYFFRYDGEDHSVTRSEPYLHQLLTRAGLVIVAESAQDDWDPELYPVKACALRPAAWYRD